MIRTAKGVHPVVLRKMRNYAIKQAISELSEKPDLKEIERVAKRHLLSYSELKVALHEQKRQIPPDAGGGKKD